KTAAEARMSVCPERLFLHLKPGKPCLYNRRVVYSTQARPTTMREFKTPDAPSPRLLPVLLICLCKSIQRTLPRSLFVFKRKRLQSYIICPLLPNISAIIFQFSCFYRPVIDIYQAFRLLSSF
ncbi:hypothetical protein, partial [Segatella baroniae]|uniref:hypothetical protein n=1 Tax=Segatella baroniae TaxID=305719 RepID=UPI001B7F8100